MQIADQREDLGAGLRVEIAGGLVAKQNRRDRPRARGQSRRAAARRPRAPRAGVRRACRAARDPAVRGRGRASSRRGQPRRCSGRATFSAAVSVGSRLKNWKIKPILSRRTRVRSSSLRDGSGWPSIETCPEEGRSRQPMMFSSVDLPDPEGPTMDTISPRAMSSVTPSSATTWRRPSNRFPTSVRRIMRLTLYTRLP